MDKVFINNFEFYCENEKLNKKNACCPDFCINYNNRTLIEILRSLLNSKLK